MSLWRESIRRSRTGAKRTEDIPELERNIPTEFYNIYPGQIVLFIPNGGISQQKIAQISEFIAFMRLFSSDIDIRLDFVHTDNELLIDNLAGRTAQETGIPYKVFVGAWDTVAGFAAKYYGKDVQEIINTVSSSGFESNLSISATALPDVIVIDPKKCADIEGYDEADVSSGSILHQLTAKPKTEKAEKKLLLEKEEKIYSLMKECYTLDLNLDIEKLKKRLEEAINDTTEYRLSFKANLDKSRPGANLFSVFDIYVADGEEYKLDLTAAEKAIYLTYLTYEKGIRVAETFWGFRETSQKIYRKLPFKERCEATAGGFMEKEKAEYEPYMSTMRTHLSHIRDKVSAKIIHPKTAIEFAVEGYKNEEYGVMCSTPEIREQIRTLFGL